MVYKHGLYILFTNSNIGFLHLPIIRTGKAVTEESTLQGVALRRFHLVLHLIGDIESIDIQQSIESPQMCAIQRGHAEAYLQVLAVELHPSDLRDIVLGQGENPMSRHLEVIRVVHVLGELETAEHIELRQINHNRDIALGCRGQLGGVNYPNAFDGRGKAMWKIGCLYEAITGLEETATA